jgi:hypothetical protein
VLVALPALESEVSPFLGAELLRRGLSLLLVTAALAGGLGSSRAAALPDGVIVSGDYEVTVTTAGGTFTSTWHLKVSGSKVTGTSDWTCCPGVRHDPLSGTVRGGKIAIERNCSLQGQRACVRQVYDGEVHGTPSAAGSRATAARERSP